MNHIEQKSKDWETPPTTPITTPITTPRSNIRQTLTEKQLLWAQNVKFHADSGSVESLGSLKELASQVKSNDTENELLSDVIKAIKAAVRNKFSNLIDLRQKTTLLLRSVNLISPQNIRAPTPPFFH